MTPTLDTIADHFRSGCDPIPLLRDLGKLSADDVPALRNEAEDRYATTGDRVMLSIATACWREERESATA